MAKDRKLSVRRQQALETQLRKERQQRVKILAIAVATVVVLFGLWSVSNLSGSGEDTEQAAWGPADASVVIEEWSDFN